MKPSVGRKIYVLCWRSAQITSETVGWLGEKTFIVENYQEYFEYAQQYAYEDFNKTWFTSLKQAKKELLRLNPDCKVVEKFKGWLWEAVEV